MHKQKIKKRANVGGVRGSISLIWHPVWAEANHTLVVSKKNAANEWEIVVTVNDVPGSSYTLAGLNLNSEHKVSIATNCSAGDPSEIQKTLDGINLIIDLAVAGHSPINPTIVDCHGISLKNNWIGFIIAHTYQGMQVANTFEFINGGLDLQTSNLNLKGTIARVSLNHPIIAAGTTPPNLYPTAFEPLIENVGNPFQIDRLMSEGSNRLQIGFVGLTIKSNTIDLCPIINLPWPQGYTFTALVAQSANLNSHPSANEERSLQDSTHSCNILAQNPFYESLNIYFPEPCMLDNETTFRLLNTMGYSVWEKQISILTPHISFHLGSIPKGVYILRIESMNKVQSLRVIKS